jgi:uncharacterized protein with HEPN domain
MLRAAVERKFEIIGEALGQFAKRDTSTAARIGEHRRIVAFRNILVHGYADVDDRLVWTLSRASFATCAGKLTHCSASREGDSESGPQSTGSSPFGPTVASTPVWTSNQ